MVKLRWIEVSNLFRAKTVDIIDKMASTLNETDLFRPISIRTYLSSSKAVKVFLIQFKIRFLRKIHT
jgi:hypothetical protein